MNNGIIKIQYLDAQGKPVGSPAEAKYTVVNGVFRTVSGGKPQKLVGGKWVEVA